MIMQSSNISISNAFIHTQDTKMKNMEGRKCEKESEPAQATRRLKHTC